MTAQQTPPQNIDDLPQRPPPPGLAETARDYWRRVRRWAGEQAARLSSDAGQAAPVSEADALAGLRSESPRERWTSAAALGKRPTRSPEAIGALVEALADPEEFVRWQAADALAAQEPGRILPVLTDLLADPDPLRRAGAAAALGRLGGAEAALALTGRLDDPNPAVRRAVVDALGEAGGPDATAGLIPLLQDRIVDVRWAAATALGKLGNPDAAPALATALRRKNQPLLVRRAAAAALARAPHADVHPQLIAALTDPDPQVRAYAARALGQVGDETAQPALSALKADRAPVLHGAVGDAAAEALALMEKRRRAAAAEAKR